MSNINPSRVTNIIIAGLGGQGVLKSTDILSDTVFRSGLDIKKSEVHGMSQRGGSVAGDVRFGREVLSPMVPPGEADYLVVLEPTQVEVHRGQLRAGGVLIEPSLIGESKLPNKKALNIALLGALSVHLELGEELWREAIRENLPAKLHEANMKAFDIGRAAVKA